MLWVVFFLVSVSVFHAGFPDGFILCFHKTCFAVACGTCRNPSVTERTLGPLLFALASIAVGFSLPFTCSIRQAGLSSVGPLTPLPPFKICSGSQWSLVPLTSWGCIPLPQPLQGCFGCFSLFTCYLCPWNVCRPLFCSRSVRPLCTVTAVCSELLFFLWWCSCPLLLQCFLLPRFDLVLLLSPCALFQAFTWLQLLLSAWWLTDSLYTSQGLSPSPVAVFLLAFFPLSSPSFIQYFTPQTPDGVSQVLLSLVF